MECRTGRVRRQHGSCVATAGIPTAGAETLRGTVVDRQGNPVSGAVVWTARLYASGPLSPASPRPMTRAGSRSRSRPGRWIVWARHDGWAGETDHRELPVVVPGRDAGPVTIRLGERGTCGSD